MSDPGIMTAFSACFGCDTLFMYDPERVPSISIDPSTRRPPEAEDAEALARSRREPICPACAKRANIERRTNGLSLAYEGDTLDDLLRRPL